MGRSCCHLPPSKRGLASGSYASQGQHPGQLLCASASLGPPYGPWRPWLPSTHFPDEKIEVQRDECSLSSSPASEPWARCRRGAVCLLGRSLAWRANSPCPSDSAPGLPVPLASRCLSLVLRQSHAALSLRCSSPRVAGGSVLQDAQSSPGPWWNCRGSAPAQWPRCALRPPGWSSGELCGFAKPIHNRHPQETASGNTSLSPSM